MNPPRGGRKSAYGCTAAQAIAAALRASAIANTVTASGSRPRLRSSRNSVHCSKMLTR